MPTSATARDAILALDIGATSIKRVVVGRDGSFLHDVERVATPYPCPPTVLVELIAAQVATSPCARVGVGFPGALHEGRVIEPGNLSKLDGFASPVDEAIHEQWLGVDLESTLRRATDRDVRVVNDATLAALGCAFGEGRELVFTLGTGFGIALVVDGQSVPIRDVGSAVFVDGVTYDEALGEHARSLDEAAWQLALCDAVAGFVREFDADVVHLGGGNARRVERTSVATLAPRVAFNDNDVALRGVVALFDV